MRSIAIARAIMDAYGFVGLFTQFVESSLAANVKVLEVNEAGNLSPMLKKMPLHALAAYPAYDIMNLKIEDADYDLVVHSDTLEHVKDPVRALSECKRILRNSGKCIFTIPIIVDRLSRSRIGLSDSYHGSPGNCQSDMRVYTEFGMDFWKYVARAGFKKCCMHILQYPAAIAIEASV